MIPILKPDEFFNLSFLFSIIFTSTPNAPPQMVTICSDDWHFFSAGFSVVLLPLESYLKYTTKPNVTRFTINGVFAMNFKPETPGISAELGEVILFLTPKTTCREVIAHDALYFDTAAVAAVAILMNCEDHLDVYIPMCEDPTSTNQAIGFEYANTLYLNDSLKFNYVYMMQDVRAYVQQHCNKRLVVGISDSFPMIYGFNGFEYSFLKDFANTSKIVISFVQGDLGKMETRGDTVHYSGLYRQLHHCNVDVDCLIAAGLYTKSNLSNYGHLVYPTSAVSVMCLVPKPEYHPMWIVLLVFQPVTWVCIITFFVLINLAVYCSEWMKKRMRNEKGPNAWRILLIYRMCFAQSNNAKQLHDRMHASAVLLTVMLIHIYYTTKLASLMTSEIFREDIKTIADLAESNLPVYVYSGREEQINPLKHEPPASRLRRIYERFRHVDARQLEALLNSTQREQFALVVDVDQETGYYNIQWEFKQLQYLKPMEEPLIYLRYMGIFHFKSSPIFKEMMNQLSKLRSNGLYVHWKEFDFRTSQGVQRMLDNTLGKIHYEAVELRDLEGHFILLSLGLALAIVAFLLELTVRFVKDAQSRTRQRASKVQLKHLNASLGTTGRKLKIRLRKYQHRRT